MDHICLVNIAGNTLNLNDICQHTTAAQLSLAEAAAQELMIFISRRVSPRFLYTSHSWHATVKNPTVNSPSQTTVVSRLRSGGYVSQNTFVFFNMVTLI
jgi:hypothetical protein